MTDLRGERVDEGKVWAACPDSRQKSISDLADHIKLGVKMLFEENAALRVEVARLRDVADAAKKETEGHEGPYIIDGSDTDRLCICDLCIALRKWEG